MVGQGLLRECLLDPGVERVQHASRASPASTHSGDRIRAGRGKKYRRPRSGRSSRSPADGCATGGRYRAQPGGIDPADLLRPSTAWPRGGARRRGGATFARGLGAGDDRQRRRDGDLPDHRRLPRDLPLRAVQGEDAQGPGEGEHGLRLRDHRRGWSWSPTSGASSPPPGSRPIRRRCCSRPMVASSPRRTYPSAGSRSPLPAQGRKSWSSRVQSASTASS